MVHSQYTIGATVNTITGATTNTYVVVSGDKDKFIKVGITPGSSAGTTPGQEYKSYWFGPIGGETVTFTYNGQTVTYGIIVSSVTSRKWLDRNLGAPSTPSSYSDYANYGDLFQWGRGADGHQLIIRTPGSPYGTSAGVNGVTNGPISSSNPGSNLFLKTVWPLADWISPSNNNLWQSPDQVNNPCPTGWHVPTKTEWENENLTLNDLTLLYNGLKLTLSGYRAFDGGDVSQSNGSGCYWTSTVNMDVPDQYKYMFSYALYIGPGGYFTDDCKSQGLAVKCIKNQ